MWFFIILRSLYFVQRIKKQFTSYEFDWTLDKLIVVELIIFKLSYITKEIDTILKRWNEDVIEIFLEKAKDGSLEEAENDEIDLKQLLLEDQNFTRQKVRKSVLVKKILVNFSNSERKEQNKSFDKQIC